MSEYTPVADKALTDILEYTKPEIYCETKALKAIAAELLQRREADRWIPVEERLPERDDLFDVVRNGTVESLNFATTEYKKFCNRIEANTFYDEDSEGDCYSAGGVTHWKERPTPPEVSQ